MPMQWYTVARLSDHMETTPEGYLLIRNVPVARCGTQLYRENEIADIDADPHGWISIDREPSEVFKAESIASFQGKPIVNDHPFMGVNPDNWSDLSLGLLSNPHRGENTEHDLLMCDMLVTTRRGIELVRSGKRALSVGYDALYERTGPGMGRQRNIICNHVALVDEGRCGARCTIMDGAAIYNYDADPEEFTHDAACGCDACASRGSGKMSKRNFVDFIQKAFFAKDKAALDAIIKDAENEEPDGDEGKHATSGTEGGVHVHIEHKEPGGDAKPNAKDEDAEKRLKGCEDGIRALDAKMTKLFDHLGVKDAGGDDDEEAKKKKAAEDAAAMARARDNGNGGGDDDKKDKTNDDEGVAAGAQSAQALTTAEPELMEADPALKTGRSMMGDRAFVDSVTTLMPKLLQDLRARAEILSPGITLPVLDAKPGTATQKGICDLRRASLLRAVTDEKGAKAVGTYTADSIKAMSCDAVRMLFNDASKRMFDMNNGQVFTANPDSYRMPDFASHRQAVASRLQGINKANADFWAKQLGRPN